MRGVSVLCIEVKKNNPLKDHIQEQSGKSGTVLESNQASGVRKTHYAWYYVRKSSILLAVPALRKISSVACGFSPIKIHFSYFLIT